MIALSGATNQNKVHLKKSANVAFKASPVSLNKCCEGCPKTTEVAKMYAFLLPVVLAATALIAFVAKVLFSNDSETSAPEKNTKRTKVIVRKKTNHKTQAPVLKVVKNTKSTDSAVSKEKTPPPADDAGDTGTTAQFANIKVIKTDTNVFKNGDGKTVVQTVTTVGVPTDKEGS